MAHMPRYHHIPLVTLSPLLDGTAPVVFLDTARCDKHNHHSYLFHTPLQVLTAHRISEVPAVLEEVRHLSARAWVAGFLSYEAGYALDSAFTDECRNIKILKGIPVAWFGVFDAPCVFDHRNGTWDRCLPLGKDGTYTDGEIAPLPKVTRLIKWPQYAAAVNRIKRHIAAGNTYQVNFTYPCDVRSPLPAWELYRAVRSSQQACYCAFVNTGTTQICSFSPELFFAVKKNRITVKPMKGTAARGRDHGSDIDAANRLAADPKNQAENLMIVDLLRNDLGRVCTTASIKVDALFEVETHRTLHQMTSTITGRLAPGITITDVFRSLFPCGSVTGAPKIHTMKIIRSLENRPRGVYCGALGFVSPAGTARFSVPIRTLQRADNRSGWVYRTGSGIIWDSNAGDEWRECALKTSFLTRRGAAPFEIVESLLWKGHPVYLREHRRRMAASCRMLGFRFDREAFDSVVEQIRRQLTDPVPCKVRIVCCETGEVTWESQLIETTGSGDPVVEIHTLAVHSREPLLRHKTTWRPWYRDAMKRIISGSVYDVIFVNEKGEVTEGARTNVFVKIKGVLYTPPVAAGLLPGVLRQRLLKRGVCRERQLRPDDLLRSDAVYCGNSVRGLVRVGVRE